MEAEVRRIMSTLSPKDVDWMIQQMHLIASAHDITGPRTQDAGHDPEYKKKVAREIRNRALAAHSVGQMNLPMRHLKLICDYCAWELIVLRRIRRAHEAAELPLEVMRVLSLYGAHQDYLDGNQDQRESKENEPT
jgi:hypothetical protein